MRMSWHYHEAAGQVTEVEVLTGDLAEWERSYQAKEDAKRVKNKLPRRWSVFRFADSGTFTASRITGPAYVVLPGRSQSPVLGRSQSHN